MSTRVPSNVDARTPVRGNPASSSTRVHNDTPRPVSKWCYRGSGMVTWPAVLLAGFFGMSGGASFSTPENKRDEKKRVDAPVRSSAGVPVFSSSSAAGVPVFSSSSSSSFARPVVPVHARRSYRSLGKKENKKKRKASSPAKKKQMCDQGCSSSAVSSSSGESSSSSSSSGAGVFSPLMNGSMANDARRKKRVRFNEPLCSSSSSSSSSASAISDKEMASRFVSENVSAGQKYSINGNVAKVENIRRSSGSTLWSRVGVRWMSNGGGYRSNIDSVTWKQSCDKGDIEFLPSKKKAPLPCPAILHCDYKVKWHVITSPDKCKGHQTFVGWCTEISDKKITLTWTNQATSQFGFNKFRELMKQGHIKEMKEYDEDDIGRPPFYPNGTKLLLTYGDDGKFVGTVSHNAIPVISIDWEQTSEYTDYSLNLFKSALEVGDIEEIGAV